MSPKLSIGRTDTEYTGKELLLGEQRWIFDIIGNAWEMSPSKERERSTPLRTRRVLLDIRDIGPLIVTECSEIVTFSGWHEMFLVDLTRTSTDQFIEGQRPKAVCWIQWAHFSVANLLVGEVFANEIHHEILRDVNSHGFWAHFHSKVFTCPSFLTRTNIKLMQNERIALERRTPSIGLDCVVGFTLLSSWMILIASSRLSVS